MKFNKVFLCILFSSYILISFSCFIFFSLYNFTTIFYLFEGKVLNGKYKHKQVTNFNKGNRILKNTYRSFLVVFCFLERKKKGKHV